MANRLHDKEFVKSRKAALRAVEALERKFGDEVFRSACRRHLENVRQEDRLAEQIKSAEVELLALKKRRISGK